MFRQRPVNTALSMDGYLMPANSLTATKFTKFRYEFPLLRDVAYFQTGSLAPLGDSVRMATNTAFEAEGTSGLMGPQAYGVLHQQQEKHRAHLASFIGAEASEIGWTTNTTTAIRHAIGTMSWQPDDTLITTNQEHISTRKLEDGLRQHYGVNVVKINASDSEDCLLTELEQALSNQRNPRLLLISHVSCQDGRTLPIAAATKLAHSHHVPVLVDGAQSLGQFPVDVHTLGCDMLVGSAHKWLLGPGGLGFLYVANQGLISFISPFAVEPTDPDAADEKPHKPLSAHIELGTAGMAPRAGLGAALDLLSNLGLAEIQQYVSRLTTLLYGELSIIPGLEIFAPIKVEQRTGITSFTLPGATHAQLTEIVATMWSTHRVMGKVQVEQPSIRISIAAFNNEDDILRLSNALKCALKTGQASS